MQQKLRYFTLLLHPTACKAILNYLENLNQKLLTIAKYSIVLRSLLKFEVYVEIKNELILINV